MSDRALPPDPADWPADPYELLGVERGSSPRDLKRAYTALIRRYKPEQAPEAFRRVREAYERALYFAELFGSQPGPPDAAKTGSAPAAGSGAPDVDEIWSWAVAGDEARAFAALQALACQPGCPPDVPLRLYWLSVLWPDLREQMPPSGWLVMALVASGLAGPALELYRRELDERCANALANGRGLFEVPIAFRPDRIAAFAAIRLTAAVAHGEWAVVGEDLAVVRAKVRPFDEPAWLGYCFGALDELLWHPGRPGVDAHVAELRRELDAAGGQSVKYADAFDRLEFLLAMTANWGELRDDADVPAALRDLLPRAWNRPYADTRRPLVEVMEQVALAPAAWLATFDRVWSISPQSVAHFANLLGQYADRLEEPPAVPFAPQELAAMTCEFLDAAGPVSYDGLRPQVLRFCLEQCVGPEVLAAVAPERPADYPPLDASLAQALAGDWPMRVVCQACRLFWA